MNFNENSILDHINRLDVNKAHGHDAISVRMIKLAGRSIARPLFIIFKNCIAKGHFPKMWKMANVIPVYKKNEKKLISNYRPVSLLPIFGKIFEKMIYNNIYPYIFNNNFISDKQSGYRRKDSTVKQLISITHEIYKAFDKSQEIQAVFLDISRAFDRVWHKGLLFKLKRIGIEDEVINILSSFLADRKQRVVIDGTSSEWTSIESGVPQGSILGPILFLVYINDLVDVVESDIRIFADDTFIFRVVDPSSIEALNRDLERITEWAFQWKMVFNPDIKKQAVEVVFSNKHIKGVLPNKLIFNGIPVKTVPETKHIGLILDEKLNFENHLIEKTGKVNQGLGRMKQLKKWLHHKALETIWFVFNRPHLDYGDVVYDRGEIDRIGILPVRISPTSLKNIETLQYEAARIVTGAWKSTSRDKLYDNLGWESLQQRRLIRRLSLFWEVKNSKFPNYLYQIIEKQSKPRLENLGSLEEMPAGLVIHKLSFFPSTIRDWNRLDLETKTSESKKRFKGILNNTIRPKKKSYFGLKDNNKVRYLTMLRMELSPLKAHKMKRNFPDANGGLCLTCGSEEHTKHFLLHCASFRLSRAALLQRISGLINFDISTLPENRIVSIFTNGDPQFTFATNTMILTEVTNFISDSRRLDTF